MILVRNLKEEVQPSGIILARDPQSLTACDEAVVIDIGPLAFSPPIGDGTVPIKIGDKIIVKRYAGQQKIAGEVYERLIQDADVCAIIEEY